MKDKELRSLYNQIRDTEQHSYLYHKLNKVVQNLRNNIIKQELKQLNHNQIYSLKHGLVTFEYRTTEQQRQRDTNFNRKLRQIAPKQYKQKDKSYPYAYYLAKGHHTPLGLKDVVRHTVTKDGKEEFKVGKLHKGWDSEHIKTIIHHTDPHCDCQNNEQKGNFAKTYSNISKGKAGKELCPYLTHSTSWKGEQLMQLISLKYGIYSGTSYRLIGTSKKQSNRLHVDRMIPKEQTKLKSPIALEYDGTQHDVPEELNYPSKKTLKKIKNEYKHQSHIKTFKTYVNQKMTEKSNENFRHQIVRDNRKNHYLQSKGIPLVRIKVANMEKHGLSGTVKQQETVVNHIFDKAIYPMIKHHKLSNKEYSKAYRFLHHGKSNLKNSYQYSYPSQKQVEHLMKKHQKEWLKLKRKEQTPKTKKRAKRNKEIMRKKVKQALGSKTYKHGKKKGQVKRIWKIYDQNKEFYYKNKKLCIKRTRNKILREIGAKSPSETKIERKQHNCINKSNHLKVTANSIKKDKKLVQAKRQRHRQMHRESDLDRE